LAQASATKKRKPQATFCGSTDRFGCLWLCFCVK